MRVHQDGHIQASRLEVWLPADAVRRARACGATIGEGLEREAEKFLGIEIDGAGRCRLTDTDGDLRLVLIESDWVAPSRR